METCDACGPAVKAYQKFSMLDLTLTYCNHHAEAWKKILSDQGWVKTPLNTESVV